MNDDDIVEVRIVGLPLDVHRRVTEHTDDVMREFAIIAVEPSTAPARLLALGDELRSRYGTFTTAQTEQLDRAIASGTGGTMDLAYTVPRSVADACAEIAQVLDEVDAYCEAGGMLTLATPAEGRAYRRWFLEEFVRQIAGRPPKPWAEYAEAAGIASD